MASIAMVWSWMLATKLDGNLWLQNSQAKYLFWDCAGGLAGCHFGNYMINNYAWL